MPDALGKERVPLLGIAVQLLRPEPVELILVEPFGQLDVCACRTGQERHAET